MTISQKNTDRVSSLCFIFWQTPMLTINLQYLHVPQHELRPTDREMLNSWLNNGGCSPKGALMLNFWINVQIYMNFYTDILPNFLFSISSVLLAADN
jgi:hypothetical protein